MTRILATFYAQFAVYKCSFPQKANRWHCIGYFGSMDENFSPRVKDVIGYSKEEALRLGHDSIGTEHLILGLVREGEGSAVDILTSMGLDLSALRTKIEGLTELGDASATPAKEYPAHTPCGESPQNNLPRSETLCECSDPHSPPLIVHPTQRKRPCNGCF